MNWYEYSLIIWIIISTLWIINLFIIIKIKEKHILEMQKNQKNHFYNMLNIYEYHYQQMYELSNERIDEVIEYLNNKNKE